MQVPRWARGPLVVSVAVVSLLGCAADHVADPVADDGSAVDELNSESLREATAVKGTIKGGTTVTIAYDKSDREYPRSVPYLALEILDADPVTPAKKDDAITDPNGDALYPLGGADATASAASQPISIQGNFPSTPKALIVDGDFKVLSRAAGALQADGSESITLDASRDATRRFVLVRDQRWSQPMAFQVTVAR